jgi:hypothetical protein
MSAVADSYITKFVWSILMVTFRNYKVSAPPTLTTSPLSEFPKHKNPTTQMAKIIKIIKIELFFMYSPLFHCFKEPVSLLNHLSDSVLSGIFYKH